MPCVDEGAAAASSAALLEPIGKQALHFFEDAFHIFEKRLAALGARDTGLPHIESRRVGLPQLVKKILGLECLDRSGVFRVLNHHARSPSIRSKAASGTRIRRPIRT